MADGKLLQQRQCRRRRSCRCRSGRCPEGRGRPAAPGWRGPGWGLGWCNFLPPERAGSARQRQARKKSCQSRKVLKNRERAPNQARENGCCRLPRTLEGTEVLKKSGDDSQLAFVRSQRMAGVSGYSAAKVKAFVALQQNLPGIGRLTPLRVPGFCSHHYGKRPHAAGRGAPRGENRLGCGVGSWDILTGDKPLAQASARGKIKWFNGTKGYGFVTLDNGGDAFCHASVLQSAGHAGIAAGRQHRLRPGGFPARHAGGRDPYCGSLHRGSAGAARPAGFRRRRAFRRRRPRLAAARGGYRDSAPSGPMIEGKVKFFNDQKGFGFVMPDSGSGRYLSACQCAAAFGRAGGRAGPAHPLFHAPGQQGRGSRPGELI